MAFVHRNVSMSAQDKFNRLNEMSFRDAIRPDRHREYWNSSEIRMQQPTS